MKIRLSQGLIYPSLVGAQCSASLEQQDNLLEWRPCVFLGVGLVGDHIERVGLPAVLLQWCCDDCGERERGCRDCITIKYLSVVVNEAPGPTSNLDRLINL